MSVGEFIVKAFLKLNIFVREPNTKNNETIDELLNLTEVHKHLVDFLVDELSEEEKESYKKQKRIDDIGVAIRKAVLKRDR